MANIDQFYRGEVIDITVNLTSESFENPSMYAYLDDLDLTDEANLKEATRNATEEIADGNFAVFSKNDDEENNIFILNGKQTRQLQSGHYTIELSYGNTDKDRVIVKKNNAFALVDSVSKFKNTTA